MYLDVYSLSLLPFAHCLDELQHVKQEGILRCTRIHLSNLEMSLRSLGQQPILLRIVESDL